MGKPRMTQRDKWAKRDCVTRYYAWKDVAKLAFKMAHRTMPQGVYRVDWFAFLPIPPSWSKKKKTEHTGKLHFAKPDRDNIDKAVLDALWDDDSGVACGYIEKRWDDGRGPRLEVALHVV
ncbi:MAG: RusA family crossover junction endodeoxyribonuclease [Opitutaceae bacterium]|nr:RusA family crossover junction endodeoxyribonuclease [Opitutaceae bacterium]